jgi:hypothetical protein
MKILTKKQVNEILCRIKTNQIIANRYIKDIDALDMATENNAEIVSLVGNIEEMIQVATALGKYKE